MKENVIGRLSRQPEAAILYITFLIVLVSDDTTKI
jgi:hypothetical protein